MTFNVINNTNGEKTIRDLFPTMYLENSIALVTLLNKDFIELGVEISDSIEMSWIESALFYTNFLIGTPTTALLSRTPQRLNPFKSKSDYVKKILFHHRSGNIVNIQNEVNWDELGVEAVNRYLSFTRVIYDYMTPFVSKNPSEAFLNYMDLDIGANSHGKNAYAEGMVYGHKYFKEMNYKRLTMVKTRVDPSNFFRNEQSIPTLSSSWK
ncbi:hypothetical protein Lser_V15G13531 [Lactuca serriola]